MRPSLVSEGRSHHGDRHAACGGFNVPLSPRTEEEADPQKEEETGREGKRRLHRHLERRGHRGLWAGQGGVRGGSVKIQGRNLSGRMSPQLSQHPHTAAS